MAWSHATSGLTSWRWGSSGGLMNRGRSSCRTDSPGWGSAFRPRSRRNWRVRIKPVMAVVGDGGMLMMVHDLTLIRELELPIVIVVFTDRSLSLIRVSESRKGNRAVRRRFPAAGFCEDGGGVWNPRTPRFSHHPTEELRGAGGRGENAFCDRDPDRSSGVLRSGLKHPCRLYTTSPRGCDLVESPLTACAARRRRYNHISA